MKSQATRQRDVPRTRQLSAHQRHIEHQQRTHDALRQLDLIHQQHARRTDRALSALVGAVTLLAVITLAGLLYMASAPL